MSWSNARSVVIVAALSVGLLGACGYRPLYGQASTQPNLGANLATVAIGPIYERDGQMLHTELQRLITPKGNPVQPAYKLNVAISSSEDRYAVARTAFATRANVRVRATFTLVRGRDSAQLLDGTENALASYNILSSSYATLAAQTDAKTLAVKDLARRIRDRVAVYLHGADASQ